jgi:hypothetical protein
VVGGRESGMRVIEQLIDHLRGTGHLTLDPLAQLRRMGLRKEEPAHDPRPDASDGDEPDDDLAVAAAELAAELGHIRSAGDPDTDNWETYGDRLLEDAVRRAVTGHRRGGPPSADSDLLAAVEQSMADDQDFLDPVLEVARRMDPRSTSTTRRGSSEPCIRPALMRSCGGTTCGHACGHTSSMSRSSPLSMTASGDASPTWLPPGVSRTSRSLIFRLGGAEIAIAWFSTGTVLYPKSSDWRADYGTLWAAGLFDLPVLTCPKEWQLT